MKQFQYNLVTIDIFDDLSNDIIELQTILIKYLYDYFDLDYRYCCKELKLNLELLDLKGEDLKYDELYIEYKEKYIQYEIDKLIESKILNELMKNEELLDLYILSIINIHDENNNSYDKYNKEILDLLLILDDYKPLYDKINNYNIFNEIFRNMDLSQEDINHLFENIMSLNKYNYIHILNHKLNTNIIDENKEILINYYNDILPRSYPYLIIDKYIRNDIMNNDISYLFNDITSIRSYKHIINNFIFNCNSIMINNLLNNNNIKLDLLQLLYSTDDERLINITLNNKNVYDIIYKNMIEYFYTSSDNNTSTYGYNMYRYLKQIIKNIIINEKIDMTKIEIIDDDIIYSYCNYFLNYMNENKLITDVKIIDLINDDLDEIIDILMIEYICENYKKIKIEEKHKYQLLDYIEYIIKHENMNNIYREFLIDNKHIIDKEKYKYIYEIINKK